MEALTAVSVACLTIYDMVKAADRGMRIEDIRLRDEERRPLRRATSRHEPAPASRTRSRRVLASVERAGRVRNGSPLAGRAGATLAEDLVALRAINRPSRPPRWTATRCAAPMSRQVPTALRVIGTSAAGHGFQGAVGPGEAVRIFTGAPLPEGADAIVIQEDAEAADGASI